MPTLPLLLLFATSPSADEAAPPSRPNVLFIACDDMNDWVGFLGGHPDTLTPNLDRLARRGVVFENAYCASPICGPSRAAVLTGLRPETSGVYNNLGTYIDYVPEAVALPRFFKDRGYLVMGAGKINHAMGVVVRENYHEFGPDAGAIGGPFTWEELNLNPGEEVQRTDIAGRSDEIASGIVENVYPGKVVRRGPLEATLPLNGIDNRLDRPANGYNTFDWGGLDIPDEMMPDARMASWAEEKLEAQYTAPFFLAVGFYRPHQPWYAPARYFEPFEGRELALPPTLLHDLADCGQAARQYAHYPWAGSFATVQQHDQWQDAIRGYLASVHFADAQVGRLIDALDGSAYADNTIIVLWSDHGWELGEKQHWGKHSPWEGSLRVPLIIVPPRNMNLPAGHHAGLSSLLDLYPTLVDLCGFEVPQELEGASLEPVLTGEQEQVRDHLVTTLGRSSSCIRRDHWKYIHYYDGSEELYDLRSDPHEFHNLASQPAQADLLQQMRRLIPVDRRFRQMVRCGRYKGMLEADGQLKVYDMLHPRSGIGEHTEVSAEQHEVVAAIQAWLASHPDQRHGVLDSAALAVEQGLAQLDAAAGQVVFAIREIPEGTPKLGHGVDAKQYGYRIPSLLTTSQGTVLAFCERRLGLHDHAQNDIVLRRSTDGGGTWSEEIVVHEDGMNSINDPLTVQLENDRILLVFARFPYGRHARDSGWIKMAEPGYDDLEANILTFVCFSDDDGLSWSEPQDISRSVKPAHWLNANTPGCMTQLRRGPHAGRVITGLWGCVPVGDAQGQVQRTWEICAAWSDDEGRTWQRGQPLQDPEQGWPNECQVAEAANGTLVVVARNQGGQRLRKKAFSTDGGLTWTALRTDPTLPSVACMGSLIAGPVEDDGSWDLYASFPSAAGRQDGQIAVSTDMGKTFQVEQIIKGAFAYSATQVSPDGGSLLCLYESDGYESIRFLRIPLEELR